MRHKQQHHQKTWAGEGKREAERSRTLGEGCRRPRSLAGEGDGRRRWILAGEGKGLRRRSLAGQGEAGGGGTDLGRRRERLRGESSSLFSPRFGVTGVFPSLSCLCLPPLSRPISLPSRQFLFLARASCWFPLNLPTHVQGVQNQLKRRLIRLGDALDASTAEGGRLRQKTKATTTP